MAVAVLAMALGLAHASFGGSDAASVPAQVSATVATRAYGQSVPDGYLGLSLEYWAIESYAGRDPGVVNPLLVQLVRNLTPGQTPVLRIGGDSADWTWWPVSGLSRPPGVTFSLDQPWLAVTRALTQALGARLILGLNLEADSASVAAAEANALLFGLDRSTVEAFELGNEPAQYRSFAWYRTPAGRAVPGRPRSYSFTSFLSDFTGISAALPSFSLAGPTTGGLGWFPYLGRFLTAAPRVRVVTVHRYPLQLCYTPRSSERYPTVAHLLSAPASTGFAQSFAGVVAVAHRHGLPLRIDELNTVSCGAAPAVSQTFASALWALDTLFELRRVGVDGVQMHTFPGAGYELFRFRQDGGRWSASVAPEYYGLMLFAAAAPVGSRLVAVSAPSDATLKVWATVAPDRRVRIVVINKSLSRARTVRLRGSALSGTGALERLLGPGSGAAGSITLGGQSFGAVTGTGRLAGRALSTPVAPVGGRYVVRLPPASAALLTVNSAQQLQ